MDYLYLVRGLVLRGKTEKEARAMVDSLVTRLDDSFTLAFNQLTKDWNRKVKSS